MDVSGSRGVKGLSDGGCILSLVIVGLSNCSIVCS